jgi:thiaminase
MGEAMTADALVSRHAAAWRAATVHPFLAGVRDGSLPEHPFDRWLAQDYLFARRSSAASCSSGVTTMASGPGTTVATWPVASHRTT